MIDFRVNGKIVIGLTGSVACGKSAAAAVFRKLGADAVSADALSAEFYKLNLKAIEEHFKSSDKKIIAAAVFSDGIQRKWLENLLHPPVFEKALKLIKQSSKHIVVFEAPLLFEAGLGKSFDVTACVCAPYAVRLKRAVLRGMKEEDFKCRDAVQIPQEEKAGLADFAFDNAHEPAALEAQIKKFYCNLIK